jgi:hypothetical protein
LTFINTITCNHLHAAVDHHLIQVHPKRKNTMTTRYLIASVAIAFAASAAFAQQAAAPAAPAASGAATMNMHDHGADRGAPMAKSHMAKASGARKAASGVKGHDHSKEKNN